MYEPSVPVPAARRADVFEPVVDELVTAIDTATGQAGPTFGITTGHVALRGEVSGRGSVHITHLLVEQSKRGQKRATAAMAAVCAVADAHGEPVTARIRLTEKYTRVEGGETVADRPTVADVRGRDATALFLDRFGFDLVDITISNSGEVGHFALTTHRERQRDPDQQSLDAF
jgi:GNAT superfamily N-acetyltransferase